MHLSHCALLLCYLIYITKYTIRSTIQPANIKGKISYHKPRQIVLIIYQKNIYDRQSIRHVIFHHYISILHDLYLSYKRNTFIIIYNLLFTIHQPQIPMQTHPKISNKDLIIIITTSPIKSNPSTVVIDMALQSIFNQPTLINTTIYIICDGAKIGQDSTNKYKSGIISEQAYKAYLQFKINLKDKYKHNQRIVIEERVERCCFAKNIKFVMQKVEHEFVMIFQHDHLLLRNVDMSQIVGKMKKYPINYIGFMNRSVQKLAHQLDEDLNLRKYFVEKVHYVPEIVKHSHEKFKAKVLEHYQKKYQLPLMPLIFWYDKVHIAKRKYYLDVIFNKKGFFDQKNKVYIKTVSFVEDSFGCFMRKAIRRNPQRFEELSAFIYWDSMQPVVFHSHGRAFLTKQSKIELQNQQRQAMQNDSSQSEEQKQIIQDYDIEKMSLN